MKKVLLALTLSILITACGGGSSPTKTQTEPPETQTEPPKEVISKYSFSDKPDKRLTSGGDFELFPTMIVTISFSNNVKRENIDNLFLSLHISVDSSPDYLGQEFAYFFENNKAYYRYTFADIEGYCCTDSTDTYYEINNNEGYLQVKLFHYGQHTSRTWAALKDGVFFNINAESKFFENSTKDTISSNDFVPEEGIFTTGGYNFEDTLDDYIGNENIADITSIDIELNFDFYKKI